MVDIHSHVLPGIDDGAKDAGEAFGMLQRLKEQGVTHLVCTPHYYPDTMNLDEFCLQREQAFNQIKGYDMNFLLGSETYLSRALFGYSSLSSLCIGSSCYLLLELPFTSHWDKEIYHNIERVSDHFGVIPIIAHVERYNAVRRRISVVKKLRSLGCLIQVNASSVVNARKSEFILKLLKNGLVDGIGSDAHNLSTRPPMIGEALKVMELPDFRLLQNFF